ncbi:MAG: glycosyltransferase family 2 protein [Lachnospiraceae bacterium]
MTRFDIIIPVYNVEEYLPDTLKSLEAQSFKDFRAILVDDGSTDSCPQLCDDFRASRPETVVIHKPNGGLISARRSGIAAAQGEFIMFCDGDDMLKPEALEELNRAICESGADMVIFNAETFEGGVRTPFFENVLPEGEVADKRLIYDRLFTDYCLNSMCLKATRRELFDADRDYSGFYGCSVAEDLLQSVPLLLAAEKIIYLNKALYDYRMASGMTRKFNPEYYFDNKAVSLDIRERLAGEGIEDFEQKVAFHLLIAAYAGTTRLKYADSFDFRVLDRINADEEFIQAWDRVWNHPLSARFSPKQRLLLKLLKGRNYGAIRLLLKARGK